MARDEQAGGLLGSANGPASGSAPRVEGSPLEAIRTQIEQQIPEELKDEYARVMVAADRIMLSPKTHRLLVESVESVVESDSPPNALAEASVDLVMLVQQASGDKFSQHALAAALIPVMTRVLEFGKSKIEITNELIAEAAKVGMVQLAQRLGIDMQQIEEAAQQGAQAPGGAGPTAASGPQSPQQQPQPPQQQGGI